MKLDEESFVLYAAKYYDTNLNVSVEDFNEDIKRFQYIKRLFKKYEETGELRTRLVMNHIIVLYNCFGLATTNMLFMKLKGFHHYLKPFIVMLNYMPKVITYDDVVLYESDIAMDSKIIRELRNITNDS